MNMDETLGKLEEHWKRTGSYKVLVGVRKDKGFIRGIFFDEDNEEKL